jgi:predicted ATP-dependent Lon-type protease
LKTHGDIRQIQEGRRRFKQIFSGFVALLLIQAARSQGDLPAYKNYALPVDVRVTDLLSRMTTEERIGQLQCLNFVDKTKLDKSAKPRDPNIGFIVNSARAGANKPGTGTKVKLPMTGKPHVANFQ